MYLSELKVWNFRKFGCEKSIINSGKLRTPDLQIEFKKGINLIVGENDSGKSAILEAIKLVCKTNSAEWIKIESEDFYITSERLRIECVIRDLKPYEAQNLIEWLGTESREGKTEVYLRLNLDVQRTAERVLPADIKGGPDDLGVALDAAAKELIQVTYLKALRDVKQELAAKRNSRLSKILASHSAFKNKNPHYLTSIASLIKDKIDEYFKDNGNQLEDIDGRSLKIKLDSILSSFFPISNIPQAQFEVSGQDIKSILESLKLLLSDKYCGLGSDNLLFIAVELLLLQRDPWNGLRVGLVEELEAHLHPQAQMRVIEYLQNETENNNYQLLLTTHSPNLASKVNLENLILCTSDAQVFQMGPGYTRLDEDKDDYKFLKRFLDVTKSNLFFAKGVILVEGFAEAILLPVIAEKLNLSLTAAGVSIINVGSAAFLRFAKIFLRKDEKIMPIKVSILTDYDFRPKEFSKARKPEKRRKAFVVDAFTSEEIAAKLKSRNIEGKNVRTFFSPYWTLEYCLSISEPLRMYFYLAVLQAWQEKKRTQGIKSTKSLDKKVLNIANEFDSWTENKESIAFKIYNEIILKQQLSKAAIAQYFSELISFKEIKLDEKDPSIQYILKAIKFALV